MVHIGVPANPTDRSNNAVCQLIPCRVFPAARSVPSSSLTYVTLRLCLCIIFEKHY